MPKSASTSSGKPVKKTAAAHHTASLADRRAEERFPAEGSVEFRFADPLSHVVEGSLRDYSKSGFRAVHQFYALPSGQIVHFRYLQTSGVARVMWNRIFAEGIETGFLVVQEQANS